MMLTIFTSSLPCIRSLEQLINEKFHRKKCVSVPSRALDKLNNGVSLLSSALDKNYLSPKIR